MTTDDLEEVFGGAIKEAHQLREENKKLKQEITSLKAMTGQGADGLAL